eukprot:Gregarina_sp_Poly_1__693@NODE_1165_length_4880_cov_74_173073_g599_i1_p3_GENE_NODE_1165_length_4880_cov_74_173073_g599_i1NODE_1165_length_4880_cov_74_173073_g599_i1_p3_ORF_typecomplete_len103_score1_36_NODE_1165_length_4880_cov_74_173073_g599_i118222130
MYASMPDHTGKLCTCKIKGLVTAHNNDLSSSALGYCIQGNWTSSRSFSLHFSGPSHFFFRWELELTKDDGSRKMALCALAPQLHGSVYGPACREPTGVHGRH